MSLPSALLVLVVAVTASCGYKVLVVFPFPTKSHSILGEGFVRNLLHAGHEVTYVTTNLMTPQPNLRQVDVSDNYKLIPESLLKGVLQKKVHLDIESMMEISYLISVNTMKVAEMQDLMAVPEVQFDVAIVEWMLNDLYTGLSAVFDCPMIWFSSMDSHWMMRRLVDGATNPAYTVDFTSQNSLPLTFTQRIHELWTQLKVSAVLRFSVQPKDEVAYQSLFSSAASIRGKSLPPYEEALYNTSLLFVNSHESFAAPIQLAQNMKYIGGYHIKTPIDALPQNLKAIMDDAKYGVIYFSLGSVVKSKDIPAEIKTEMLTMFATLNQTVIWKFEEVLFDLPNNVHILQWAPQLPILSHPNCVLFITHGGLLSTTEAIHAGIPFIGIPIFADQFNNIQRAVFKEIALRVDLTSETPLRLLEAINEMVSNKRYRNSMKHISSVYHDRARSPGEELVYWTEYVVRTKGATHLRSPALLLPWYQKMYLDLAGLVLLFILSIIVLVNKTLHSNEQRVKCKKE